MASASRSDSSGTQVIEVKKSPPSEDDGGRSEKDAVSPSEEDTAANSSEQDSEAGGSDRHRAEASGNASRPGTALLVLAALVTAAALAAATWAGVGWFQGLRQDQARADAVDAARTAAVNLTSIDFRSADRDVRKVLDHSTGEFAALFQQNLDSYTQIVKEGEVVTTGKVVEAGVESADARSARVLLAVESTVHNKQVRDGESRGYRMVAGMEKEADGQWRVARVEFTP